MKKIFNLHVFSLILVVAIVSMFSIIKVNAAITWKSDDGCIGSSFTITRTLNNVPTSSVTNNFGYTLTPNAGNPGTPSGTVPSSATVSFTGSETVTNHTVSKTTSVNFNTITSFPDVGYYTYSLAEASSTDSTTYPIATTSTDTDSTHKLPYTVRVWVSHAVDGEGVPTSDYVACMHVLNSDNEKVAPAYTTNVNSSQYSSFTITKKTTGNMAEISDYFPITISLNTTGTYNITGLTAGSSLCTGVASQTASTTITGNTAPITKTVCIKHGDTVVVGKDGSLDTIPTGTALTLTETPGTYTPSYKVNSGSSVSSATLSNHSLASGETTIAYTNDKTEPTPTGVIITVLPYILLVVIVVIGTVVYMNLKKKEDKNK